MKSKLYKNMIQDKMINSMGFLPNPDKILNRYGRNYDVLRDLQNDPHVWSCVQSRKGGLLSLDFQIQTCKNKKLNNLIQDFFSDNDIHSLINEILEAVYYGFSAIEIVWQDKGGQLVPKQFIAKPQEWFSYDENNQIYFIRNRDKQKIENIKLMQVSSKSNGNNPYGTPLLSKVYWAVKFKNNSLKFWMRYMEKFGLPVLLGQYKRGAKTDEIDKLLDSLMQMTEDSVIVVPSDIDVQINESKSKTSVELYKELIKFCNSEISKAILSQTLTTEVGSGSLSASQTHLRIRQEVIESDMRLVEQTMNRLIKTIVDINYSDETLLPKFKFSPNGSDKNARLERDKVLANSCNIRFSKQYWAKHYDLAEDEFTLVEE